jgi:hypothetical protein
MPTIQQAQAKALDKGFLDNLGSNQFTAPNLNTVEAMISLYAEEFLKAAQDNLNKDNKNQTGKLADSIRFETKFMKRGFKIDFFAADYYDFVNEGVKGVGSKNKNMTSPYKFKFISPSRSHVEAIMKWMTEGRKKIVAKDVKKYGKSKQESKAVDPAKKQRSLAYIIARSTKIKGIKRTGFWSNAFDDTFKDFGLQMSKALGKDIRVDLQSMRKQVNKKK